MLNRSYFPVVLVSLIVFKIVASELIVSLPNGLIKGRTEVTGQNVTFYAFQEVPYGQPPIGSLRFQAPKPAQNWEGVLDCTQNLKYCYQTQTNSASETEDCLYLNIYTPVLPGSNASLPVLYYIVGGGFINGIVTFSEYGPHYLVKHDVIIVTVSYRVGPFGGLSTGDDVILGNNGLKDQNLGLQWVQKNIHLFGGDPKKVTIFGQSAGAASVIYQLISNKSAGLFRAAIAQSGTALCPWAYQRNAKSIAYQVAALVDPNFNQDSSSEELLAFLQSVNASVLDVASNQLQEGTGHEQIVQGFWYAPVIEPNVAGAFITERMYKSVSEGNFTRVPLLTGICSEESSSRALFISLLKYNALKYDLELSALVNDNLHISSNLIKTMVGSRVRDIFTTGMFANDDPATLRYFSDESFNRAVIKQAQLQSQFTDVYFYQFSYRGVMGLNPIDVRGAEKVMHGEDTKYLWTMYNISNPRIFPKQDGITMERYTKLYTDFAKNLNPTPQKSELMQNIVWPKVTPTKFQYLDINTNLKIKSNPKADTFEKWVKLYDDWAVKPYDTY